MNYDARCAVRRERLDRAVEALRSYCATKTDIVSAHVFGSYVRGDVHPHSDLDLLIVRETEETAPHRRVDDIYRESTLGVGFDAIAVTPTEFRERLPLTPFGQTILKTSRCIYERR